MEKEKKTIYVGIKIEGEGVSSSFHFKDATVGELALINAELDIIKLEILERINEAPKDYEIKDYGEDES